jgi:hypothetical protein
LRISPPDGAAEQDDAPGRGGVEVGGGQEAGLGPMGLNPAAADDRPLGVRLGPGGQPGHGLGDRGRALEVEGQFAPADAVEVGVAVGEAGEQGGALQVDGFQSVGGGRVGGGADVDDASVAHLHHLGGGGGVDAGVDRPAADDEVLGRGGRGRPGEQEGEEQGAAHLTVPETGGLRTRNIPGAASSSRTNRSRR